MEEESEISHRLVYKSILCIGRVSIYSYKLIYGINF